MFHPGKVLLVFAHNDDEVVSAEDETQAVLSMWDDNLITVLVHKNLSKQIKVEDVVLVDYRPISSTIPVPKLVATKILRGKNATEAWKIYKEKQRALSGKPLPFISSSGASVQPPHSYIG